MRDIEWIYAGIWMEQDEGMRFLIFGICRSEVRYLWLVGRAAGPWGSPSGARGAQRGPTYR